MARTALSPSAKKIAGAVAVADTALKAVALADLAKRDDSQVNGSKKVWGLALTLVNSVGILPLVYFLKGRRTS